MFAGEGLVVDWLTGKIDLVSLLQTCQFSFFLNLHEWFFNNQTFLANLFFLFHPLNPLYCFRPVHNNCFPNLLYQGVFGEGVGAEASLFARPARVASSIPGSGATIRSGARRAEEETTGDGASGVGWHVWYVCVGVGVTCMLLVLLLFPACCSWQYHW
jgi:hypothetical protein